MEKVKFVQIGCGKMSIYTIAYAMENGYEIVGAVDVNPEVIGKDVSSVIGCDEVGVAIKNVTELDTLLKEVKPDIAIVTTMSLMNDLEEVLMTCAKNGVNAITTCEEAFYPANSSPRITEELDKIQKLHFWIEYTKNNKTYVIDYLNNIVVNKEGYYLLTQPKFINEISSEQLNQDTVTLLNESFKLEHSEILCFYQEFEKDLKKIK